jgi:hypothetical protein
VRPEGMAPLELATAWVKGRVPPKLAAARPEGRALLELVVPLGACPLCGCSPEGRGPRSPEGRMGALARGVTVFALAWRRRVAALGLSYGVAGWGRAIGPTGIGSGGRIWVPTQI